MRFCSGTSRPVSSPAASYSASDSSRSSSQRQGHASRRSSREGERIARPTPVAVFPRERERFAPKLLSIVLIRLPVSEIASFAEGTGASGGSGSGSRPSLRSRPCAQRIQQSRFLAGGSSAAEQLGREALGLARERGDRSGSGYALNLLGMIAVDSLAPLLLPSSSTRSRSRSTKRPGTRQAD